MATPAPASPVVTTTPSVYNPNQPFLAPASGPVSGTDLFCSAMYIKTQQLHIVYKRVSEGVFNMFAGTGATNQDFNLSSVTVTAGIAGTKLMVEVYGVGAAYILSGDCWDSSAYTQNQSFLVASQESLDGVSYGGVSAGCLGPAGTIYNPASGFYSSRTPLPPGFDPAAYPVYTFSRFGYNYRMIDLSGAANCQGPIHPNVTLDFNKSNYDWFAIQSKINQTPSPYSLCGQRVLVGTNGYFGQHVGPYSAAQDTQQLTINVVNSIGAYVGGSIGVGGFLAASDNSIMEPSQYNHYLHTW